MAKANTTKYRVTYNGQEVDVRVSTAGRVYTHAVVARRSEEHARKLAHAWTKTDLANAEWSWGNAQKIVAAGEDRTYGPAGLERAKEVLAYGNCMAYVQHVKESRVAEFEKQVADGRFRKFELVGYCGRPDLAQKLQQKTANEPWYDRVYTVVVERL